MIPKRFPEICLQSWNIVADGFAVGLDTFCCQYSANLLILTGRFLTGYVHRSSQNQKSYPPWFAPRSCSPVTVFAPSTGNAWKFIFNSFHTQTKPNDRKMECFHWKILIIVLPLFGTQNHRLYGQVCIFASVTVQALFIRFQPRIEFEWR